MASTCRSCDAPIVWVATEATLAKEGKAAKPSRRMPLDADPDNPSKALVVDDGNIIFTGQRDGSTNAWLVRYVPKGPNHYRSHFATCPNAAAHRKTR